MYAHASIHHARARNTIKKEKENFWFYNNGITIGCEDFVLDGYVLRLYNFSIINGAQTTTKIGESKLIDNEYDFDIVCKVVKANRSLNDESDFIMKISEASNSQKPIKARDLKANAREQKMLQTKCAENKNALAIEIKRGVKPKNYYKVEKWQRVTNEYIGQLILACLLQRPGSARSGKITIFTSEKLYLYVVHAPLSISFAHIVLNPDCSNPSSIPPMPANRLPTFIICT